MVVSGKIPAHRWPFLSSRNWTTLRLLLISISFQFRWLHLCTGRRGFAIAILQKCVACREKFVQSFSEKTFRVRVAFTRSRGWVRIVTLNVSRRKKMTTKFCKVGTRWKMQILCNYFELLCGSVSFDFGKTVHCLCDANQMQFVSIRMKSEFVCFIK